MTCMCGHDATYHGPYKGCLKSHQWGTPNADIQMSMSCGCGEFEQVHSWDEFMILNTKDVPA
jgi:hypothetical protein